MGPTTHLAERLYFGDAFEWTWKVPVAGRVCAHLRGDRDDLLLRPRRRTGLGLADARVDFATALWLMTSLVFKYYVANFGNYNETYGAMAPS